MASLFPITQYSELSSLRHVINNSGSENKEFLNGEMKGMIPYSLFMKGLPSEVTEVVVLLCFHSKTCMKSNRT